jgi:predicted transglutaminase-like cysteine proteinase
MRLAYAILSMSVACLATNGIFGFGAQAAEMPSRNVFGKSYGRALPPIGFVKFCKLNPLACQEQGTFVNHIVFAGDTWSTLTAVNESINSAIAPVSDEELYGVPEFWTYPINAGDCEDYLLLKKRNLENLGFAASSLLITVVLDEKNEGHAVLTVVTDRGDYVLDNRRNDVVLWTDTGYRFLKRQSQFNPREWVALTRLTDEATQVSSGE